MRMVRVPGYYWVKYADEWTIGEKVNDSDWNLLGSDEILCEDDFTEIGEKIEHGK